MGVRDRRFTDRDGWARDRQIVQKRSNANRTNVWGLVSQSDLTKNPSYIRETRSMAHLILSVGSVVLVNSIRLVKPIKMVVWAANCLCFPCFRNILAIANSSENNGFDEPIRDGYPANTA